MPGVCGWKCRMMTMTCKLSLSPRELNASSASKDDALQVMETCMLTFDHAIKLTAVYSYMQRIKSRSR